MKNVVVKHRRTLERESPIRKKIPKQRGDNFIPMESHLKRGDS